MTLRTAGWLVFILIGCDKDFSQKSLGSDPLSDVSKSGEQSSEVSEAEKESEAAVTDLKQPRILSLFANSLASLPDCGASRHEQLAYVLESRDFFVCSLTGWVATNIKGPAGEVGAIGATGSTGIAGTDGQVGPTGPTGPKGPSGDTGPQGPQGPQGSAGQNGADGVDVPAINVLVPDGTVLGRSMGINSAENLFYVVATDGKRFEVDQTSGLVKSNYSNATIHFAGAGCTGTVRMMPPTGSMANVVNDVRGSSNQLWAMTGSNLGSFSYQSKVSGSSCVNGAGTLTISFAASQYTAPKPHPFGRLDLEN